MFTLFTSSFQRTIRRNALCLASSLLLATAAIAAGGCGDDDDDNTNNPGGSGGSGGSSGGSAGSGAVNDGCARGTLEADLSGNEGEALAGQTKLVGPGVDAAGKLKPGSYVFSSTYLRMPTTPQTQARFGELADPIVQGLPAQPGLVAFSFSSGPSCTTVRTLTVWENEEAMYGFAATASHRTAAAASSEVSRGGSAVTHWSGTEADGTWTKSAAELAATPAFD